MKLYDLLKDVKIKCLNVDLSIDVSGISSDSRNVSEGDLFVAINGNKRNGNDYIEKAIEKGAIAVVSQENSQFIGVPYIKVENDREALAKIWNSYYGYPSKQMKVIAFTGTNGKTSCVHLLKSILKSANLKYGVISTIGCEINGEKIDFFGGSEISDILSSMTTPDPKYLYELIYRMKNEGVEYVIMEASSHALNQSKLVGIDIYIGAFTNLSSEHLDYHGTMENYFDAKKKLFDICKHSVINIDSKYGLKLKRCFENSKTVSLNKKADFYGENIILNRSGCEFIFYNSFESYPLKSRLIGDFVPQNIIISATCASILGISKEHITKGIYNLEYIDGRMEKITENIYIDYAHTPEAFEKVLSSMKAQFNKKMYVLFGCGGNRDKTKRAKMGKIASKYADKIIITSDNSRDEDTLDIIKEIFSGVEEEKMCYIIPNRRDAITFAINQLDNESILLLLGKGHEKYEIINGSMQYFNEKEIVREACIKFNLLKQKK